jgi:heat-inducible transcriptional repressor
MVTIEKLTERERQVFLSIVHCFIQTAEPVGSRYLAKRYNLNISPATIRNVMIDLEEKGLINQPHTSAGRMPTDAGYRHYVNSIINTAKLDEAEKSTIIEHLDKFSQDVNLIIKKSTEVLGDISNQLGVVLGPQFNKGKLKKIDLVPLSDSKLLIIMSIQSGFVKTIVVEINDNISKHLLESTCQLLNERLHGLSVNELQQSLAERFNDLDFQTRFLVNTIKDQTDKVLNVEAADEFYFSGARNVITQPEFRSEERIEKMFELLDRKDILVQILNENKTDGVSIVIGEENSETLMKNCSLITTTFQFDDVKGTLGIIGPTRMHYAKIIALVQFMAETLSYLTTKSKKT